MGYTTLKSVASYSKQVGRGLIYCEKVEAKDTKDDNPDWKTYYKGQIRDGRKVYTILIPGGSVVAKKDKNGKEYCLVSVSKRYSRKRYY